MAGARLVRVPEDGEGMRLDRWLRRGFPSLGQARVERMCRKGEIRLDGARVRASARLRAGQSLRVPPLPDSDAAPARVRAPEPSEADAALIRGLVMHEDEHMAVINKPHGLAVQGGSGQGRHIDALAGALAHEGERVRLAHRLDMETSGVLVLAKTARSARALAGAFRSRDARKIYWAVVAGAPSLRAGTIRYSLAKGEGEGGAERMRCVDPGMAGADPEAKSAHTDYMVIEALGKRAAWVCLAPLTGRKHQLRAHMARIGHPVIGDVKYGKRGQVNMGDGWGARLGGEVSSRLHLHARGLRIAHPESGKAMEFVAPLPDHMERTWESFGWSPDDVTFDPFESAGQAGR